MLILRKNLQTMSKLKFFNKLLQHCYQQQTKLQVSLWTYYNKGQSKWQKTWAQKYTFIPKFRFDKCKCKTYSFAIRTQFTPLPNNIYAESKTRLYFFEYIWYNNICILLDLLINIWLVLFCAGKKVPQKTSCTVWSA